VNSCKNEKNPHKRKIKGKETLFKGATCWQLNILTHTAARRQLAIRGGSLQSSHGGNSDFKEVNRAVKEEGG